MVLLWEQGKGGRKAERGWLALGILEFLDLLAFKGIESLPTPLSASFGFRTSVNEEIAWSLTFWSVLSVAESGT